MKHCCIGILAHVDAGKTTLSEALLYRSGKLKSAGRVDHGDTALDTHELEKRRGITIFSSEAVLDWNGVRFSLLDTPGHVDFSAEMERTLRVLDCAVLVISGSDGVQAHTETLWRLLRRYGIPCFLFVTKMDLAAADRAALLRDLTRRLSDRITDFTHRPEDEELAMCSEALLEKYMDCGSVSDADVTALISDRALFPCYFGSGLKLEGIDEFLDGLARYAPTPDCPAEFGAQVYKISYDGQGNRLTHLRLFGGGLKVRTPIQYTASDGTPQEEKITRLLCRDGAKLAPAEEAEPGSICAVMGLSRSFAGQGLGFVQDAPSPALEPALTYQIILPEGVDDKQAMPKLKKLEEEDPLLRFSWDERLREIQVQLMGQVQIEVLETLIAQRFDLAVRIGEGRIRYRETIAAPVEGAGHYEPLRHYAEVHLLLEPLEPGRGLELESDCSTDLLDLNWQRLILTHLAERTQLGVLTGSPVTDLRITLIAGRAHLKHTEGGDFRQATYRALRQGLMKAQSVLLEPYYDFRLEVPVSQVGRAISDLRTMHGEFDTETGEASAVITGTAPVSTMRGYLTEVMAYTGGRGRLSCIMGGYRPCHNSAEVIAAAAYDPEADQDYSPDSIFCAHGAGYPVKWDKVDEYCHLDPGRKENGERVAPRLRMGNLSIDEKELEAIMEREFGPIRRPMYTKPTGREPDAKRIVLRQRRELLVIDGYNVIFAWEELKAIAAESLDAARRRLGEILTNYRGFTGSDVVLVFDGYAVKDNPGEKLLLHGVEVVYTKENESADLYIERLLHDIGRNYSVRVVTSDNLIRLSALGSGILRTSAREFGNEVDWVMGQIGSILRKTAERSHTTIAKDSKL